MKRHIRWYVSCIILVGGFFANSTLAAIITTNPMADAFVTTGPSGSLSSSNYGGAGGLSVAASGLSQGEFQTVLKFDLSSAKASFDSQFGVGSWSIQSAALQLTAAPPNNPIFNPSSAGQFSISWMQNDSWVEGTGTPMSPTSVGITFSTLNTFLSGADETLGTFNFGGGTNGSASYTLNLTSSFKTNALAGGTLSLRMFAADSSVSYLSDSRSFGTASARPLLTITAVPEPASFALAAFGLCIFSLGRLLLRSDRE